MSHTDHNTRELPQDKSIILHATNNSLRLAHFVSSKDMVCLDVRLDIPLPTSEVDLGILTSIPITLSPQKMSL